MSDGNERGRPWPKSGGWVPALFTPKSIKIGKSLIARYTPLSAHFDPFRFFQFPRFDR